jgi:hypothetical protein
MCHAEYIYACLVMEELREPMTLEGNEHAPSTKLPHTPPFDPMRELASALLAFFAVIVGRLRPRFWGPGDSLPGGCC